jgi:purine-nucleoside/S-methyl-5'-thioadenosine phosphorylase / adenosine deaminase
MIAWDAPGPYVIAFTTREGGVSTGPYASLNLGSRGDDPSRIAENRRLACEQLGLDAARLTVNRQRHTARAVRAGEDAGEEADALWTDEPGRPLLALAADCVPVAIVSSDGRPSLAVVHAGWRGLAAGIVGAAVDAMRPGAKAAMVGPAIGPCCYEVGREVAERFDDDLVSGRLLDLWTAAERSLRQAGVEEVRRLDLCTRCHSDRFFSHRASGGAHGAHGVIGAVGG